MAAVCSPRRGGGEVGRPYENHADPWYSHDLLDVFDTLHGFDLDDGKEVTPRVERPDVGPLHVIADAPEPRSVGRVTTA